MSLSTRIGRPVAIRIRIVHSCIEQRFKFHNRKNYVTTQINSYIKDGIFMFQQTSLFEDKNNVNAMGKSSADARARVRACVCVCVCGGGWVGGFLSSRFCTVCTTILSFFFCKYWPDYGILRPKLVANNIIIIIIIIIPVCKHC